MKIASYLSITTHTAALRLIGQIIAFISGLLISTTFGATSSTDTYYASLIIPTSLANLVINILCNMFAPIYLEYIHRDPTQQQSILTSLNYLTSLALLGAVIIGLFAVPISFSLRNLSASNLAQASTMGVALVALTPLIGMTRLSSTICEAHGHYRLPAIAALLNPFAFVLILLITTPTLGIYSLVWANLAGQTTEFLILTVYAQRRLNFPIRLNSNLHPAVREMLIHSVAPAVTYGALMFVPAFDRTAAAILDAGNLTAFHYGERIVTILDLVMMTSIISIISNYWAQQTAKHNIDAAARTLSTVLSPMLFVLIPLCAGGFALRYPLFSVLFHHGQFTLDGAAAQVFGLLLLSAPLNYMIVIIVRLMLIARNTRAQMILALSISMLNLVFNFLLVPSLGLAGIAISTLLSRALVLVAGFGFLKNQLPQINLKPILFSLIRTFACVGIMIAPLVLLQSLLSPALSRDNGLLLQIAALLGTVSISGIIYVAAAYQIRHPELSKLHQIAMTSLMPRFNSPQL